MDILAICGSLQAKSSNLTLLERAIALAPDGVRITRFDGLRDLPHFNPDLQGVPMAVEAWRAALARSDAFLIACPEYGHSLPGVLKNAIDWVIGSGELERAVVAITAATSHADRGRMGLQALRQTLLALSVTIVGDAPIVKTSPTFDDDVAALVRALVDAAREKAR